MATSGRPAHTLTSGIDPRWRIVESSFSGGLGATLISDGLSVDIDRSLLTDKLRRRSVTGVTEAVIGFQHGRCLLCDELITPADEVAVDHVFPFSFMKRGTPLGYAGLDLARCGTWLRRTRPATRRRATPSPPATRYQARPA